MKKTIKSLLAIAITAFAFTACSDVPAPYDMPGTGGGGGISGGTGTGQVDDPFNIAAAIAKCKEIGGTESTEKYYVKGIVVTGGTADGTYGNVTFDMADEAGSTTKFKAFQVLGSDAKKLPEGYEVKTGDEVIVYGPIYNYNGKTPETAGKGAAFIYSINGKKTDGSEVVPPGPSVEPKGTGTKDDPFNIAAAIKKCQEIGQTESAEKYYVKGIAATDAAPDETYGNATIDMIDKEGSTDIFKAFQVLGTDGKKMPKTYTIAKGSEIVVYGPIYNYKGNTPETAGKGAAYIVTVNGQPTETEGGGSSDPGEAKGSGTLADPYNIAAIIKFTQELAADEESSEDVYFKGKISQVKNKYVADDYGNATFYISEDGTTNNEFYCFRTLYLGNTKFAGGTKNIKVGDEVIICGKVVNYKGNTLETASNKSYLYSLNGKTEAEPDEGGEGGGGEAASELTNGNFETWADGLPTGWKSASTASSATLEQSTDAHGGNYSVLVKGGGTANKRLASQEIKLAAGTYVFAFYAKAVTSDVSQARPGYAIVINGAIANSDYKYGNYSTLSNSEWTLIKNEFTLDAETTVCLLVMNPKANSDKTSGKDILVDDATLTKK